MKINRFKISTFKVRALLLFLFLLMSGSSVFAASYKVSGVNVTSQSATLTYGTASSTTYTITLSESGNGSPSGATSVLSLAWGGIAPTGVTITGLGTIALTGNGQTVTFTITTSATTEAGTDTFTISATNNSVTSGNVNFVVGTKALTITANNIAKVYGTTQSTPVTGSTLFTATGLVNGDTVGSVTLTYGSGALLATSAAGATSTITPSAATGGTFTASNYTITYANGTLTVTAAPLTITANNGSKTYGQTYTVGSGSTAFTSTGLKNSQTIGTITLASTGATSGAAVGSYNIVPSAATGGSFTASNYNITYTNGTLTVNAATPTVTVTVGSYTYTGSAQGPTTATNTGTGTTYTFSYSGTGGTTYGPSATRPTNAGTYTATATVAANGNYASASSTATAFTIATVTPTVTVTIGSYTYTGSAQGPNSATNTGTGTSYTFSYSGTGGTTYGPSATRPSNVGSYTATATVAANGNYASASSAAAFSIGAATPVVVVNVLTYTFNGSAQGPTTATNTGTGTSYTFSYSGTGGTTYGPSATRPTNVGSYTATATVAANGNYTSGTSSATAFTVAAATPIVTVTVGSYTYTGSAQGPTVATNTGTGTSYTFSYLGTTGTIYGPSATRPTNAGNYKVTATVAANGNYTSASNSNTTFTIQQAPLSITATDAVKDYGTTYTLGTTAFTATGLVGGQTIGGVTLTSAGAAANAAVGTYTIVPSAATGGTFSAANYTITYNNGTLTVNGVSVGGTVTGDSTLCAGTGATLVLSGQMGSVVRWEYAVSPFNTWLPIAATTTTYTSTGLTETTRFRAVVQYGSSAAVNSTFAEVTVGGTTTWNGTVWSNGTPDTFKTAVIAANYTSSGADITACALTVNNNATVIFSTGDTVDLTGALTVEAGSHVTFETNANLIQHGAVNANSGSVTIKRESAKVQRLDYTLWTAPVVGQQLQAFSPQTLSNRFYTYNTGTNLYDVIASPTTTNFEVGKGYLIRVGNNHSATQPLPWLGSFTGVPNNGDYTIAMQNFGTGNGFNLIGNPYPSPIDPEAFINDANNAVTITGTLYFWRKTNGSLNPTYCTFTPFGGFVSNGHAVANEFSAAPNKVIQAGQGFFVEATGDGNGSVVFTNTMRSDNHDNHFLKTVTTGEKHRIWLNATNASGAFSQTMVGYITNATQGVDNKIDGKYINDGDIALASLINGTPYAIQGRSLPFDAGDIVPLQFKATTAGEYTIALDHVDGLFTGDQNIYLRDNLTGAVHELHAQGYTFSTEAGVFTSRFEVLYQLPLGVSNPTLNAAEVIIYRDTANNLVINTGSEIMTMVKVFDIKGSLLTTQKGINANHTTINLNVSNEVVLVQVTSDKGVVVTKKYMMQRMSMKKDKETMVRVQLAEDE